MIPWHSVRVGEGVSGAKMTVERKSGALDGGADRGRIIVVDVETASGLVENGNGTILGTMNGGDVSMATVRVASDFQLTTQAPDLPGGRGENWP